MSVGSRTLFAPPEVGVGADPARTWEFWQVEHEGPERRSHPRRTVRIDGWTALAPERLLPRCETIDVSMTGLLLAFDEPIGLPLGHRVVVSLMLDDGRCHVIGSVCRVARGTDFRTYAAIDLSDSGGEEIRRLHEHVSNDDAART